MADRSTGLFDVDERLGTISAKSKGLERIAALVDSEVFRPTPEAAAPRRYRSLGGRPPFDHILMSKVLILQARHSLSDERTEFLIGDRLSFKRFLGLGLADPAPEANMIQTFREAFEKASNRQPVQAIQHRTSFRPSGAERSDHRGNDYRYSQAAQHN